MDIYTIYKATNLITNKSYIGFTKKFSKRKNEHKYESFHKKCVGYDSYFHRAIRKYGWQNFTWEILYQSLEGNHCKDIMENYFIMEYNSFINGYNKTLGGDGCLGFKHTKEHKEKLRKMYLGQNNPMYGRSYHRNNEHKNNMSKLLKGIKKTPEHIAKRVNAVSQQWIIINPSGEKKQIKNLKEFCRINKLNPSSMSKVAYGKQTNHKGWKCSKKDI
jgi:group I intron endonuclease